MLAQLRIVDFAIIEEVELQLHAGFNVLTGETGAGKSIIVGAAGLLRGGRAGPEVVRTGAKEAVIEAVFDLTQTPAIRPALRELGLPADDDELLVRRVVPRGGRSRIYANGSLCTLSLISGITAKLIDISGQHEHQSLSDRGAQLRILDELAGAAALVEAVAQAQAEVKRTAEARREMQLDERQRAERTDFLRYQLRELEAAQLRPGEDGELAAQQARLQRAAELYQAAAAAEQSLYSDDGSLSDQLAALQRRLGELARVDPQLELPAAQLDEARLVIEDAALSLGRYAAGVDLDPAALREVEQRLELLHQLKRKHGVSTDELLGRMDRMQQELAALESHEERLSQHEAELLRARRHAEQAATALTAARETAARQLARGVARHLEALCMEGARLQVVLEALPPREDDGPALLFGQRRLGPRGWDRAELRIAANPGEEPRALAKVASGGELSRVMLALRQVVGKYDPMSTSIYDEVDAGVGGKTADVVGRSLAQVAQHRQVLCVTHLPQVAAYGDRHFHVGKSRGARRAAVSVTPLAEAGRIEELARMLGASRVTAEARANARELLRAAGARCIAARSCSSAGG